jgi:hypothetical protein
MSSEDESALRSWAEMMLPTGMVQARQVLRLLEELAALRRENELLSKKVIHHVEGLAEKLFQKTRVIVPDFPPSLREIQELPPEPGAPVCAP